MLLLQIRDLPRDGLRVPRYADGDFVPVEEPLDVPKVPLFLLPREPGGPDKVEVRLAEKFDEPEKDPERHPLAAALARFNDAERAESVVAAHVVDGERGGGGVGAERLEQGTGQPAKRPPPRLGVPGRTAGIRSLRRERRTWPSRRSSFRTMRSVGSVNAVSADRRRGDDLRLHRGAGERGGVSDRVDRSPVQGGVPEPCTTRTPVPNRPERSWKATTTFPSHPILRAVDGRPIACWMASRIQAKSPAWYPAPMPPADSPGLPRGEPWPGRGRCRSRGMRRSGGGSAPFRRRVGQVAGAGPIGRIRDGLRGGKGGRFLPDGRPGISRRFRRGEEGGTGRGQFPRAAGE